jgi:actin-related protein 6
MCSERIMTPELLFHPNDIGLDQPGLPELIKQAIDASPKDIQPFLYSNIFVAGGNANLPNFCPRLERELRCLAPSDCDVRVFTDSKPVHTIWRAASKFAIDADFPKYCVTRAEYQEFGSSICARRFAAF